MGDITCSICKKNFTRKQNLYRHLQGKHKMTGLEAQKIYTLLLVASNPNKTEKVQSRIMCPEEGCKESFRRYKLLRGHLINTHKFNISKENLTFGSEAEFQQWKENYERLSGTSYILQSSPISKANSIKTYYYCHCSYEHRRRGKGIRTLKRTGSNKIGVACPSTIVVSKTADALSVEFYKTHATACKVGVQHTRLSKMERTQIAEKLQRGMSFQQIIDEYRGSATKEEGLRRIHLVNKKDLHNICRDFKISNSKPEVDEGIGDIASNSDESTPSDSLRESTSLDNARESTSLDNARESTSLDNARESTSLDNARELTSLENARESTSSENAREMITLKFKQIIALCNNSTFSTEQLRLCCKYLDLVIEELTSARSDLQPQNPVM